VSPLTIVAFESLVALPCVLLASANNGRLSRFKSYFPIPLYVSPGAARADSTRLNVDQIVKSDGSRLSTDARLMTSTTLLIPKSLARDQPAKQGSPNRGIARVFPSALYPVRVDPTAELSSTERGSGSLAMRFHMREVLHPTPPALHRLHSAPRTESCFRGLRFHSAGFLFQSSCRAQFERFKIAGIANYFKLRMYATSP